MNAKKVMLIVAVLVVLCVSPSLSHAANGFCGYGWGGWGYTGYTAEYVPYYAMHPPVYYSYPVPRAYGWSPFAYPPGTMTPEILGKIETQEMINPHVPQKDSPSARPTSNKTTANEPTGPIPQVVINPFVKDALAVQ
jgi:hypothetical protein